MVEGCHFGCDPDDSEALCADCRQRLASAGVLPSHKRRMRVVELPINSSEDRVVGTIDIEAALRAGAKRFEPGVLAEANRNILYVDEVNLLDDHLVDVLLDAAAMGVNVVEREGVSFAHPSRFILVGTMNPEEGELRPQLLDRFGLCVDVEGIRDPDQRVLISERDAAFKKGEHEFANEFAAADHNLSRALAEAIVAVKKVRITPGQARLISSICVEAEVLGHRADVVIDHAVARARRLPPPRVAEPRRHLRRRHPGARAPRAPAAAPRPGRDHLARAGRRAGRLEASRSRKPGEPQASDSEASPRPRPSRAPAPPTPASSPSGSDQGMTTGGSSGSESAPDATEIFNLKRIDLPRQRRVRKQGGKRSASQTADRRGRYVRAQPKAKVNDLAIDATVRAAAPMQKDRGRLPGERLKIERDDLRQKVRERKIGNLIVFVVDASASMDAEQRMAATKGAILSLLQDAYVRRDRVAVVIFKNRTAEVVLRPTSSVSLARRRLEKLSVGGHHAADPRPDGRLQGRQDRAAARPDDQAAAGAHQRRPRQHLDVQGGAAGRGAEGRGDDRCGAHRRAGHRLGARLQPPAVGPAPGARRADVPDLRDQRLRRPGREDGRALLRPVRPVARRDRVGGGEGAAAEEAGNDFDTDGNRPVLVPLHRDRRPGADEAGPGPERDQPRRSAAC